MSIYQFIFIEDNDLAMVLYTGVSIYFLPRRRKTCMHDMWEFLPKVLGIYGETMCPISKHVQTLTNIQLQGLLLEVIISMK